MRSSLAMCLSFRRRYGAALLLALLVGCGGAAPTPSPTATPAPTATLAPTATPAPTAAPSVVPTPVVMRLAWAGYASLIAQPGDTLDDLGERGGSAGLLIARYNRLEGELRPGRPLIVPQLPGRTSTLSSTPLLIAAGLAQSPIFALTMDSLAEPEPVAALLDALDAAAAPATFFVTEPWMRSNPELLRRIAADHALGLQADPATLPAAVEEAELTLAALLGPEASLRPFFRPLARPESPDPAVAAAGFLTLGWAADPLTPSAAALVRLDASQPDAPAQLAALLEAASAAGLTPRPLTEVLDP